MKKKNILFFLILIMPLISSISVDMNQDYSQGETLIAIISGNFYSHVSGENIYFYRGNARVSVASSVMKIENTFYLYALLPEKQGNYSLIIKNLSYMEGSKLIKDDIQRNFTISEGKAEFSVNPGFVITKGNFSISVQNLQPRTITLNVKINSSKGAGMGFFESLFGNVEKENSISFEL